jgi:hypothetical protein
MAAKTNWALYERLYITGLDDVTLEEISGRPGAPSLNALKKHSTADNWGAKRAEYRNKQAAKALDRALESSASDQGKIIADHLKGTEGMRRIARFGFDEAIKEIEAGTLKVSIETAMHLERHAASVDAKMLSLARDQDTRVQVLFDLFIDVLEEVVPDPTQRKTALKRMAQALEATRL